MLGNKNAAAQPPNVVQRKSGWRACSALLSGSAKLAKDWLTSLVFANAKRKLWHYTMRATLKLRVFECLSQPFSLAQLRQTLDNAIEQYGLGQSPPERLRKRLGHRIKLLRVERDWSLNDMAAATKLVVSQISSIERGANLPSIESLLSSCKVFDRKPSEILASIDF